MALRYGAGVSPTFLHVAGSGKSPASLRRHESLAFSRTSNGYMEPVGTKATNKNWPQTKYHIAKNKSERGLVVNRDHPLILALGHDPGEEPGT